MKIIRALSSFISIKFQVADSSNNARLLLEGSGEEASCFKPVNFAHDVT